MKIFRWLMGWGGLFLALGLALVLTTFSIVYFSGYPEQKVHEIVQQELSKAFQREVVIGSVSGNLITQVKLKNLLIANNDTIKNGVVLDIGELTANYSLWRLFRSKGDIFKAMTVIRINHVRMAVIRDRQEQWNVLSLLVPPPPPDPENPPPPPQFRGKIYLNNMYGFYEDQKGWGERPLTDAFVDDFHSAVGVLDFENLDKVKLSVSGKLQSSGLFTIDGYFNEWNGQYAFKFAMRDLSTKKWGDYVVPVEGFKFGDSTVDITGDLVSKNPFPVNDIPFFYKVQIAFKDVTFKLPFFDAPIQKLAGLVRTNNTRDDFTLEFPRFTGVIHRIPIEGEGRLEIDQGKVDMFIQTEAFDIQSLKALFPAIKGWSFKGTGDTRFLISGESADPRIVGELTVDDGTILGSPIDTMDVGYEFFQDSLAFDINAGNVYGGPMVGGGIFDYSGDQTAFSFSLKAQQLDATRFEFLPDAVGHMDFETYVEGTGDAYVVDFSAESKDILFYDQKLDRFSTQFKVLDRDIVIDEAFLTLNGDDQPIRAEGQILDFSEGNFSVSASAIRFGHIRSDSELRQTGRLTGDATVQVPFGDRFKLAPIRDWSMVVDVTVTDTYFYNSLVDKGVVRLVRDGGVTLVEELALKGKKTSFFTKGEFDKDGPINAVVRAENVDIESYPFIEKGIPARYRPVAGIVNTQLLFDRQGTVPDTAAWFSEAWWAQYSVTGLFAMSRALVMGQPFDEFTAEGRWDGRTAFLNRAMLRYGPSVINAKGRVAIQGETDLLFQPGSTFQLQDFRPVFPVLKTVSGQSVFSGRVTGAQKQYQLDLRGRINAFQTKFVSLDSISGRIRSKKGQVSFENLQFKNGPDAFRVTGFFDTAPMMDPKEKRWGQDGQYRLRFETQAADVERLAGLIEDVHLDLTALRKVVQDDTESTLESDAVSTYFHYQVGAATAPSRSLFSRKSSADSLGEYDRLTREYEAEVNPTKLGIRGKASGQVSGYFVIASRTEPTPYLEGRLSFVNAAFRFLKNTRITVELKTVKKALEYRIRGDRGFVGKKAIDRFDWKGRYLLDGILDIHFIQVASNGRRLREVLKGHIPLSGFWRPEHRKRPINLEGTFRDNDIGLIAILSGFVDDIRNTGLVKVSVKGALDQPVLDSSQMQLSDTEIHFSDQTFIRSPFRLKSGVVSLKKNAFRLAKTVFNWTGKDTQKYHSSDQRDNVLGLDGSIVLKPWSMVFPKFIDVDLDLTVTDTELSLNWDQVYQGDVALRDIRIDGVYPVAVSTAGQLELRKLVATEKERGPLVTGAVSLSNGRVVLPAFGEPKIRPTVMLDLDVAVDGYMFVEGSLLGSSLLAGFVNRISLEIENTRQDLEVSGTLNAPKIRNSLEIADGYAYFLNRNFEMLPEEKQRLFFRDRPELVKPNSISFETPFYSDLQKYRLTPFLDLKALTLIDRVDELDTAATTETGVVMVFTGPANDIRSIRLEEYDIDNPRSAQFNATLRQTLELGGTDSNDELLSTLSSDISGDRGAGKFGETQVNALLRSRLRPVEKSLAKSMGLYDVRFNYNLGRDIFGTGGEQNRGRVLGIDLIANLLNANLFFRVRTNVDFSAESRAQYGTARLSEFELTYYIYRNVTFNYANISNPDDPTTFRPIYNLKYRFEF